MKTSERKHAAGVLAFVIGALVLSFVPFASLSSATVQQTVEDDAIHDGESIVVRDSVFALLADQTIPAGSYIHLYDTHPYIITNGHVAVKIPCDDDSNPLLDILAGAAPDLTPVSLHIFANLSTPGELCLYHSDLPEDAHAEPVNATDVEDITNSTTNTMINNTTTTTTTTNVTAMITDIAILNPGDEDITLPETSTVVIGVNEIARGAHGHPHEEHHNGTP